MDGLEGWHSPTPRGRALQWALIRQRFDQIPVVLDQKRKLRFSVTNTDDGTAIKDRVPQNRSKKGPGTERAITGNQGSLFDGHEDIFKVVPISRSIPQPGLIVSWFLCTYSEGDEVRAELSCPIAVEGGFFADFSERLVIIGPDDDGGGVRRRKSDDDSDGSEFDIPVVRK